MPINRKQEPKAKKSESEVVRRQSIASSSQADQDMPKVMEEILTITSFCSYARPAQPCPIRRLGPLKSAETSVIKHPI